MPDAPAPDASPAVDRKRRAPFWPFVCAPVGAVIALGAYAIVDGSSSDGNTNRPAAATPPTSTPATPEYGAKVYRIIAPSLVFIETNVASESDSKIGSGVVVNAQGQIMTANHVVEDASDIEVTFGDGTKTSAHVVSSAPENDIAVLAPDSTPGLIVPAVLNGGGIQVGDDTFSVGNPLGLAGSLTAGVISGLNRAIPRENGLGQLDGLIQFDAAVNPGSSGGPLLNRAGQVIGIVTALANPSSQRFFVGIGFAVPIKTAGGAARAPDQ